jgi:hypothetical protein
LSWKQQGKEKQGGCCLSESPVIPDQPQHSLTMDQLSGWGEHCMGVFFLQIRKGKFVFCTSSLCFNMKHLIFFLTFELIPTHCSGPCFTYKELKGIIFFMGEGWVDSICLVYLHESLFYFSSVYL